MRAVRWGAGLLGAVLVVWGLRSLPGRPGRPGASGDVGVLRVYGQTEAGPVLLRPGERRILQLPQDLAFTFTAAGSGPRHLRIELDDGRRRWVMHEEAIELPRESWPLGYVMELDDTAAGDAAVIVTIESPHTVAVEAVLPIRLLPAKPG